MATLTQDEIRHLSAHERLTLIERLWDSLADADVAVTAAQRSELESRLAVFEEDRPLGVTWEVLRAELSARAP